MQNDDMKTVDLCVPNGGGLATIKRLMKSINLVNGVEFKHIIIADQGDCGGGEWLKSAEKEIPNLFVIFNSDNIPPPSPYNDCLDLSRSFDELSEYIHFLDDDMEILDGTYLKQMMEFYETNDIALMSTEQCYFGPRPIPQNGIVPDFGMGAFLFKRNIFVQLGFLDERYFFHCSDSDLCTRVKLILKKKIAILPGSMTMLRHYHQLGTRKAFKGLHQETINRDWVIYKEKWDNKDNLKLEFQERLTKIDRKQYWSEKCKNATI